MITYKEALKINEQYALDNHKEPSAIKILMMHFTNFNQTKLVNNLDKPMPEERYKAFLRAVDDYVTKDIPVQHITKEEVFFGHTFEVGPEAMIPRCETEELVANTLDMIDEHFEGYKSLSLLDVGTGSGCLAITLALEDKRIQAVGTEISEKALSLAEKNNKHFQTNVTFYKGDLMEPVNGQKFDIIVSNPPYIPNDEYVEPLVKDHEPHIALFGGLDGLDYYRKIIKDVRFKLNDHYLIAFEHAWDKSKALKKLIKKELKHVQIIQKKDMQGKDRMTFVMDRAKPESKRRLIRSKS